MLRVSNLGDGFMVWVVLEVGVGWFQDWYFDTYANLIVGFAQGFWLNL